MERQNRSKEPIDILEILRHSWLLYRANFSTFVGISALGSSLTLLGYLLQLLSKTGSSLAFLITGLPGMLLGVWASLALVIAVSHRHQGKVISIKDAFQTTKGKYWRYVGTFVLYSLIMGAGFLLLVIPGLYWGTIFSLALVAVVLEKEAGISSFKASKLLIQGSFWRVFALGLITSILFAPFCLIVFVFHGLKISQPITSLLLQLLMLGYIPLLMSIHVTLYHTLKGRKQAESVFSLGTSVQRGKGFGCLTMCGLVILIIVLSAFWMSGLKAYVRTDKGKRIANSLLEKISPPVAFPITFPGGVTLDKPAGWLVIKRSTAEAEYSLIKSENTAITGFTILSVPIKSLNLSSLPLLDDPALASSVAEVAVGKSRMKWYVKMYTPGEVKILNLGNHAWREYTLTATRKKAYGTKSSVWKNAYSIVNDSVLIGSYWYTLQNITDEAEAEKAKVDRKTEQLKQELLPKEEEDVRNILASMRFPAN